MAYEMKFSGELRFADGDALKRALREVSHEGCWEEAAFRKRDLDINAARVRASIETSAPASTWETSCAVFEILAFHALDGRIEATFDDDEVEVITAPAEREAPVSPQEALERAAAEGDLDGVAAGIAAGLDVGLALHCGLRHLPVVEALLAAGASAAGTPERRPLRTAAQLGYTKTVRALLAAGAEVDATEGVLETTALQMACFHGHLPVVKVLLAAGADPTLGRPKDTPLELAATSGSKRAAAIQEALREAMAR